MNKPAAAARLGVPDRGMLVHQTLPDLLAPDRLVLGRRFDVDALLAWGRRPSARRVERLGRWWGLPVWHLEDGFLRSLAKGRDHPPLGLLVDDLGVHFDATAPSRLEWLIGQSLRPEQRDRARHIRALWCEQRLSKVNPAQDSAAPRDPFVLVVDQSAGDLSIRLGFGTPGVFRRMLQAALAEHPNHTVVVRVHPDVLSGRAKGHFLPADLDHPRIQICADGLHPAALLEQADAVYVVTSQMGFEALLWGRPVHCFGMPFYAGWGLTLDRLETPKRRQSGASLEALVHAALVRYSRCIDPHQRQPCTIETLMEAIGLQRRWRRSTPQSAQAFGFTPWKQKHLRRFLAGGRIDFRYSWQRLTHRTPSAQAAIVWGRRIKSSLQQQAVGLGVPVLHVEDGFLRSVGLGADLIEPISWVVDRRGVYYDATGPSDLEDILNRGERSSAERNRARCLRQRLVETAITKYNLQAEPWQRPSGRDRVVLVVGQVERDASIRYGAPGLRTNLGLLQAVRQAEPDAFLVYKPHPDVLAGLCRAGDGEDRVVDHCDLVLRSGSMQQLFTQVDALHVLTSLAGFEALLRGLEVHCWGLPFFAGWGLTCDRETSSRRGRVLHLDDLVHAALVDYPRYVSRHSGWFISPEQAIDELLAWRANPPSRRTLSQALFRYWGRLRR